MNIIYCIGSETYGLPFALNIATKNSRLVFIYPVISHCEQQLDRKYLAAGENYSHTNVTFFIRKYHFMKEGKL